MRKLSHDEYVAKFWANVDKRGPDECWLWLGPKTERDYGYMYFAGKHHRVHRLAYILTSGAVPPGLEIDHLCRSRLCCNPAHLEAVTHRENVMRGDTITAAHAAATHCPQGHPYDEENTTWYRGMRYCRICSRDHKRAYKQRMKAAA